MMRSIIIFACRFRDLLYFIVIIFRLQSVGSSSSVILFLILKLLELLEVFWTHHLPFNSSFTHVIKFLIEKIDAVVLKLQVFAQSIKGGEKFPISFIFFFLLILFRIHLSNFIDYEFLILSSEHFHDIRQLWLLLFNSLLYHNLQYKILHYILSFNFTSFLPFSFWPRALHIKWILFISHSEHFVLEHHNSLGQVWVF